MIKILRKSLQLSTIVSLVTLVFLACSDSTDSKLNQQPEDDYIDSSIKETTSNTKSQDAELHQPNEVKPKNNPWKLEMSSIQVGTPTPDDDPIKDAEDFASIQVGTPAEDIPEGKDGTQGLSLVFAQVKLPGVEKIEFKPDLIRFLFAEKCFTPNSPEAKDVLKKARHIKLKSSINLSSDNPEDRRITIRVKKQYKVLAKLTVFFKSGIIGTLKDSSGEEIEIINQGDSQLGFTLTDHSCVKRNKLKNGEHTADFLEVIKANLDSKNTPIDDEAPLERTEEEEAALDKMLQDSLIPWERQDKRLQITYEKVTLNEFPGYQISPKSIRLTFAKECWPEDFRKRTEIDSKIRFIVLNRPMELSSSNEDSRSIDFYGFKDYPYLVRQAFYFENNITGFYKTANSEPKLLINKSAGNSGFSLFTIDCIHKSDLVKGVFRPDFNEQIKNLKFIEK